MGTMLPTISLEQTNSAKTIDFFDLLQLTNICLFILIDLLCLNEYKNPLFPQNHSSCKTVKNEKKVIFKHFQCFKSCDFQQHLLY